MLSGDYTGECFFERYVSADLATPNHQKMSAKSFCGDDIEVISRQTLRHHRWAKDERESRRSLLERPERNRVLPASDTFASGREDRQGAPAQQPVFGDTPIRAGPSPYAWGSLAIFSRPAPREAAYFRSRG